MSAGKLIGVGVGPGDPELLTLKAMRTLGVVAYMLWQRAVHPESPISASELSSNGVALTWALQALERRLVRWKPAPLED